MAPQPMGHVFKDVDLTYNVAILEQRPAIARLVAQVVTQWSVIEMYIGLAFASLVGETSDATMIVYDALTTAGAKDAALMALARQRLSREDADLFSAVIRCLNKVSKDRNLLAHGVVASRNELQDGIVIIDSRLFTRAYYAKLVCEVEGQPPSVVFNNVVEELKAKSPIYREADLVQLIEKITYWQRIAGALVMFCRRGRQTDEGRRLLSSVPDIVKELARINRRVAADGTDHV